MKFQYLGTVAAEGWPAVFCSCEACRKARVLGGKNLRTRSQAIVDDWLLLDFPPDAYWHEGQWGIDFARCGALLVTHNHSDHFYAEGLEMRLEPFAHTDVRLDVYGSEQVRANYERYVGGYDAGRRDARLSMTVVRPFEPFRVGRYTVTALEADHDHGQDCFLYILDDGESRLFYGHDTGYLPDATWEYIRGMRFDLVSLDCNHMLDPNRRNHMDLATCCEVKERMLQEGCGEDTLFYLNHFSHNSRLMHDEFCEEASHFGFGVAYDGLILAI